MPESAERSLLTSLKERVIVENIEPDDPVIKLLFPHMLKEHLARYQFAASQAELLKSQGDSQINILDIASARGYGSNLLKHELPEANIFGVELGGEYAKKAHKKYPEPHFIRGDARKIPLSSNSMDMVTAFEITEHLSEEDQKSLTEEIMRVLKPGGRAIISVPRPYSGGIGTNVYHLHEPTQTEMKGNLEQAGFKVLETLGQIYVPPKQAEKMKKLNRLIPVWSIFAWGPSRDVTVRNAPEGKVALTNIYVVEKPST